MIRCGDWIIDLRHDDGNKGGEIVEVGTPETVAEHPTSHTGRYLKQVLHVAASHGNFDCCCFDNIVVGGYSRIS